MARFRTGWFKESYRHSLAAKGITTRRYLARDYAKGNRDKGFLKAWYAAGHTKAELGLAKNRQYDPMYDLSSPEQKAAAIIQARAQGQEPLTPLLPPDSTPTMEASDYSESEFLNEGAGADENSEDFETPTPPLPGQEYGQGFISPNVETPSAPPLFARKRYQ